MCVRKYIIYTMCTSAHVYCVRTYAHEHYSMCVINVYISVHAWGNAYIYIPCLSEAHACHCCTWLSTNTHTLAIVTVVTNLKTAPHKLPFTQSTVHLKVNIYNIIHNDHNHNYYNNDDRFYCRDACSHFICIVYYT